MASRRPPDYLSRANGHLLHFHAVVVLVWRCQGYFQTVPKELLPWSGVVGFLQQAGTVPRCFVLHAHFQASQDRLQIVFCHSLSSFGATAQFAMGRKLPNVAFILYAISVQVKARVFAASSLPVVECGSHGSVLCYTCKISWHLLVRYKYISIVDTSFLSICASSTPLRVHWVHVAGISLVWKA